MMCNPPRIRDFVAKLDVDAAAGHVRGDRYGTGLARVLDDLRFLLVVLGVEHAALDAAAAQQRGEALRLLDRPCPDEDRPALFVLGDDLVDDRFEFRVLALVDDVGDVAPDVGLVGRHHDDLETVDVSELAFFRLRGSRHAEHRACRRGGR